MIGILLAGGQSRRFGSPKAFAKKDHFFFYEISYQLLASVCHEVIIVSSKELFHRFPENLHVIVDKEEYRGKGPLAGIHTAMKNIKSNKYVVLPCDMPYLTNEIIQNLVKIADASEVIAVQTGQKSHPLVSVWSGNICNSLELFLRNDHRSVLKFLQTVDTKWIDATNLTKDCEYHFYNMNRPRTP